MGKDSGPSTQNVTQTNLPAYARPYFERMMSRAEGASNEPYALYGGPRISDFNQDQLASFDFARGLSGLFQPGMDQATGMISGAGQELATSSPYQAGQFDGNFNFDPGSFGTDDVTAQMVSAGQMGMPQMFTDAGISDQYMSPFIGGVLDASRDRLQRDFAEQNVIRQGEAARSGGFGGGRQGVAEGVATRGLNDTLGNLYRTGLQGAYENAQQQFERDRTARMGAEQFNIEQALRGDLANQGAGLQAALANQGAGLRAQELADVSRRGLLGQQLQAFGLNEEARQRQAQLAETRAQTLGGLGGLYGDLTNTGLQGNLSILNAMQDAGLQQQQREQASLDLAYGDFVNQRDYDRQNLQFLNSILRGVPMTANSNVMTYENSNPYSQMLGLGLNAYALANAFGQGQGGSGGG